MRYGDIIMFRPSGLIGKLITIIDGSQYSHGAIYLGTYGGQKIFIESHEKKGGVVIVRLEEWRRNYDIYRPKNIKSPKDKRDVLKLLNTPYDYGRLLWILKSKVFKINIDNNDDRRLICTELCDYVWRYNLGNGFTCTPRTIEKLAESGKLMKIDV